MLSRVYVSAGKSQPGKTLFLTDKGQESTLQVSHFHFHKAGLEFELYILLLLSETKILLARANLTKFWSKNNPGLKWSQDTYKLVISGPRSGLILVIMLECHKV